MALSLSKSWISCFKAKLFEGKYERKLDFPGGWRVQTNKPLWEGYGYFLEQRIAYFCVSLPKMLQVESTNFVATSIFYYVVIQEQPSLSFWNMLKRLLRELCLQLARVRQLLDWLRMSRDTQSLRSGHLRLVHWFWQIKVSVWLMSLTKWVIVFCSKLNYLVLPQVSMPINGHFFQFPISSI